MWMTIAIILLVVNVVLQLLDFSVIVRIAKEKQKMEILDTIEAMKSDDNRTLDDKTLINEIWIKIYTFF